MILSLEQITKKNEACTSKVTCSCSVEFGPRWWCHLTNHTLPSMLLVFKHIVCLQRQKNKIKRFTHFVLLYGLQNKLMILKDELPNEMTDWPNRRCNVPKKGQIYQKGIYYQDYYSNIIKKSWHWGGHGHWGLLSVIMDNQCMNQTCLSYLVHCYKKNILQNLMGKSLKCLNLFYL